MKFHFYSGKNWTCFRWNFEIWAVQQYENLVDLEKCCKMTIWLLSWLSIQPRTSLSKFEGDFIHFSFVSLPAELSTYRAPRNLTSVTSPLWRKTNEKMKWKMKISHKFRKFLAFSEFFSHFFSRSRDILSLPEYFSEFCEIPEKFHQIFAEKS